MRSAVGGGDGAGVSVNINAIDNEWINIIRAKMNGRYVNLLIDTGSNRSAISWQMAKNLNLESLPLKKGDIKRLYACNGIPINVKGQVHVNIDMQGRRFGQMFTVLDELTAGILLGCDFLQEHKAIIDMSMGCINFKQQNITVPLIRKAEYVGIAKVLNAIEIPARGQGTASN